MRSHPNVRTYCDCFGHTLVAQGSVGAMLDVDLCVWDIAATEVLMAEAGGRFVQISEYEDPRQLRRYDVVFGTPRAVDWMIGLIDDLGWPARHCDPEPGSRYKYI